MSDVKKNIGGTLSKIKDLTLHILINRSVHVLRDGRGLRAQNHQNPGVS